MNIGWKGEFGPEIGIRIGLVVFAVYQFKPNVIPRFPGGVDIYFKVRGTRIVQNVRRNVERQVTNVGVGWVAVDAVFFSYNQFPSLCSDKVILKTFLLKFGLAKLK